MTHYEPLSDAVGVLHTRIVTRRWVTGCDGIAVELDEAVRPVRCLVWNPNTATPADLLQVAAMTLCNEIDKLNDRWTARKRGLLTTPHDLAKFLAMTLAEKETA